MPGTSRSPSRSRAHGRMERAVGDPPVTHLDDGRVDEHGRVHALQGARAPLVLLGHDPLGDAADGLPGHARPVDLPEVDADLAGGRALGVQGQHDLVHAVQPALPLPDHDGLERAVAVARHLDPGRADRIAGHGLGGGAVARVPAPAALRPLAHGAAQMPGHLLVQGRLQHGLGELPEQAVRPGQVQAFLPGHAHEFERCLLPGAARPRLRLLRRCHVFHCPSRHHPPAFPATRTKGSQSNQLHTLRDSPRCHEQRCEL